MFGRNIYGSYNPYNIQLWLSMSSLRFSGKHNVFSVGYELNFYVEFRVNDYKCSGKNHVLTRFVHEAVD
jgi:hypothetical protein